MNFPDSVSAHEAGLQASNLNLCSVGHFRVKRNSIHRSFAILRIEVIHFPISLIPVVAYILASLTFSDPFHLIGVVQLTMHPICYKDKS